MKNITYPNKPDLIQISTKNGLETWFLTDQGDYTNFTVRVKDPIVFRKKKE